MDICRKYEREFLLLRMVQFLLLLILQILRIPQQFAKD